MRRSMRSIFPNQRGGFHCFFSGCFQTPRDCSVLFVYAHFSSPNSLDLLKAATHNCVNELGASGHQIVQMKWQNGKVLQGEWKPTSPWYTRSIVAYAPADLAVAIPACSHHKQTTPPILYFPLSLAPSPSRWHNAPLIYRRSPGIKREEQGNTTPLHQESKQNKKSCINKEQPRWETVPSDKGAEERRKRQKERTLPGATLVPEKPAAGEKTSSSHLSWSGSKNVDFTVGLGWVGVLSWCWVLGFPLLLAICSGAKALDKPGGKACSTPFGDEEGKGGLSSLVGIMEEDQSYWEWGERMRERQKLGFRVPGKSTARNEKSKISVIPRIYSPKSPQNPNRPLSKDSWIWNVVNFVHLRCQSPSQKQALNEISDGTMEGGKKWEFQVTKQCKTTTNSKVQHSVELTCWVWATTGTGIAPTSAKWTWGTSHLQK